jgi:DNA-binding Lrp family transcriptional regulator
MATRIAKGSYLLMRDKILTLLEKDGRLDFKDLAIMINEDEADVAAEIAKMKKEQIICGFNTLINWDKTDREYVTALIEVKVSPERDSGFDKVAERIYQFPEVRGCYLMSGGFDLTVMIEARTIKDVAFFVSHKLSAIERVLGTATHFMLKKYKDYGIIIEDDYRDERMIVSP